MGHEEWFPPPRLSAGCGFRKETIAGMLCNGEGAPIPAICGSPVEPRSSTIKSNFAATRGDGRVDRGADIRTPPQRIWRLISPISGHRP